MKDLDIALERFTKVNARLTSLGEKEDFTDTDLRIRVCKIICRFLNTELKVPVHEIQKEMANLPEELLYLSNLRCKEVALPEKWWKEDAHAMLGLREDGIPVALLPGKLGRYTVYDPVANSFSRLDKKAAASIKTRAIAVFRPFPAGEVNAKTVLAFLAGESIGWEVFLVMFFGFLAGITKAIPPMFTSEIFDVIIPNTLRGILFEAVVLLLCFNIANIGFRVVSNVSITRIFTKLGLALEGGVWDRLLEQRLAFFNQYTSGELLKKLQSIGRIKALFSGDTLQILVIALFSFLNVIVMVQLDAAIAVWVLLMFLALLIVYTLIEYRNFKYYRRYIENENKAAAFNQQALDAIERIKVSRAEERIFKVWSEFETENRYLAGRIKILENLNKVIKIFFETASVGVIFYLAAQKTDMGLGRTLAFIGAFLALQSDILPLLDVMNIVPLLAALCQNVMPILQGNEVEYNASKIIPMDMTGKIEVNNLSFRYGEFERNILSNVYFKVEEGKSLGIIGPSGSGKSSLFKALLGFYPLAEGKIYYGGYDLDTLELRYLRKQMGVVLQNGVIPSGSIFDILTDSDRRISTDMALSALDKVNMAEEVSRLPKGIHTPIEECDFSDEKRQRIMIARTLVEERRFIFFDEPTSRMDNISQQRILEHIYRTKATKIIVAQRLNTVKNCDKIIILGKGGVITEGCYDEIIKNDDLTRWLT
ncbi:MAG: ATP-binding cassette domain-containing protein [Spirochaetaceae bacterium]|jgi:ATP-binding cassette subfamily C protein|nr:ATP-binding cassette domain-containing protein [Spirochaetaceae bacterium]